MSLNTVALASCTYLVATNMELMHCLLLHCFTTDSTGCLQASSHCFIYIIFLKLSDINEWTKHFALIEGLGEGEV